MEDQEKTTFSLDDGDDEVVEEEVIERDEEYDDDDDEEEYDEEEEYDDEEPEEEDDYYDEDDGYNDDYYDDRLNKVLDEIAELKRGMQAPSTVVQQQPMQQPVQMPPQYIYQPSVPSAGSEVVMYNEISRLRDELAKNQSSLEMQKELAHIKDDMARDQRFAESQYNAEIKRLQDKIEDLLKNGSSPQNEQLPPPQGQDSGRFEGNSISSADFDKLLSINEAVLRTARDSDSRIQNEISHLKKLIDEFPSSEELDNAVSAVKKAIQNINDKGNNAGNVGADTLSKISADISALKDALQAGTGVQAQSAPVTVMPTVVHESNGGISAAELLRQLYEIKNVLGSSSSAAVKRTQTLCDLVNDYKKVDYDVNSQTVSYKEKLASVVGFAKKLSDCGEQDALDLIKEVNGLIGELADVPVDRAVFADLVSYCSENGNKPIPSNVRDSAERFFNLSEKISNADLDSLGDYLPDLIAEKNEIQSNSKENENNVIFTEITDALLEETRDEQIIKEKIEELATLKAGDVFTLPLIEEPKTYKATHSVADETVFSKLAEIKTAILDELHAESNQAEQAESEEEAEGDGDDDLQVVIEAIDELKAKLTELTGTDTLNAAIKDVHDQYLDISKKVVELSEKIAQPAHDEEKVMTSEDKDKAFEDLEYIRSKLDDYELFINQIGDLRTDILNISDTIDFSEQFNELSEKISSVLTEITAQCDKLYEDISNVLIESENNIINRISESTALTDAIADAKADILADTQALRDAVAGISDTVLALPIGDAVEQLRGDVLNLSDQVAIGLDTGMSERQKLLDDIAFIREQAEIALAEKEQAQSDEEKAEEESESEKLYGYLNDILAKVEALALVPEDVAATKDATVSVLDSVTPLTDSVLSINDAVTGLSTDIAGVRETANAALDALAPINERIGEIIERMDAADAREIADAESEEAAEQQPDPIAEDLGEIKDDLNTILDTLPLMPQSEDLVTARDNTYSILDTLTMMPQSEDLITTRDNVVALTQSVNAITESLQKLAESDAANTETIAAINAALPEGLAEDIAVVRDNTATVLDTLAAITQSQEDVQYIRQKLDEQKSEEDETVSDSIANIMQDIGLVLDKLEAFEQIAADNKHDIIDTIGGIREEIHINELDETISATGVDDETRDLLVSEIAEIRDRLAGIEGSTQTLTDVNTTALDNIAARLDDLQAAVSAPIVQSDDAVSQTLDDVSEKLNAILDGLQGGSLVSITEDIADIKARIDGGEAIVSDTDGTPIVASDSLQAIIDELAVIKGKIDAESEFDTVEEILSLREDVKAARIVDQNEVSSELESIKNELAAISSGSILDEIRALRDDVASITGLQNDGSESASAPTDGELNLVLNEIVSLRDEVFAFKDEVLSATAVAGSDTEEQEQPVSEDVNNILDELSDLREAQGALTDTIEDLKDVISRRTTLAAESDNAESSANTSNELNVVLDEIINLKNDIDTINDRIPSEAIDNITKQIEELRDTVNALIPADEAVVADESGDDGLDDIRERLDNIALANSAVDFAAISDRIEEIGAAVDELRLAKETAEIDSAAETGVVSGALSDSLENLRSEMEDIKAAVSAMSQQSVGDEIAELRAEIENLRAENENLRRTQDEAVADEIRELKDAVRDMALAITPAPAENGETSYAALIDEIKNLKESVESVNARPVAVDDDLLTAIRDALADRVTESAPLNEELSDIRDEIAQLRSLTTITAESGSAAEIAAMRNDIAELKDALTSSDSMYGMSEDITSIKADVQTLKDEPDLGVMNEILALRDEFQSLREQIEDVKKIAGETDKQSDDTILNEVQSLRDQLFAISMANVNDSSSGETNYESYNNIILDEISSLRDQIDAAGSAEEIKVVSDELANLKATLDKREELYDALAERVERLGNDATNNRILDELSSLRTELANQRDADMTTLNFMSEMAHLLERQNSYIAQNTGSKITDEIESLKAEIASSDGVAEEVAKLREIMTQSGNASDNETILGELAELREELSSEKPSRENELILQEIARLRDEITALTEREHIVKNEPVADDDLAGSLSDLKDQLNEIAGIVEPEKKTKQAPRKKSASKSGGKAASGAKKQTTGAKRGRKPKSAQAASSKPESVVEQAEQPVEPTPENVDIEAKVDEALTEFGGGEMALDPNAKIPSTNDTLDVADKLAQQVANKLVIEQLVEQLADGGMTDEQVDEILRELPVELTTTALDEQSNRVRKLANQLVLNKLRNRLEGRSASDDGENTDND